MSDWTCNVCPQAEVIRCNNPNSSVFDYHTKRVAYQAGYIIVHRGQIKLQLAKWKYSVNIADILFQLSKMA